MLGDEHSVRTMGAFFFKKKYNFCPLERQEQFILVYNGSFKSEGPKYPCQTI
jgi:hypothetical protein